jgi:OOP family OmpA-OmpF porin
MKKLTHMMIAVFMGLLATACAPKNIPPPFTPTDLNGKVSSHEYVRKVDNFIVVFDDTESMYLDRLWQSKLEKAKLVGNNMNNTIPTLDLQAGMRVFGPRSYAMADGSPLQYGMTTYSKSGLADTINAVTTTGGNTPMTRAIELANADLANTKGDSAVILISDGEENIKVPAVEAVRALKEKYGDRVCVYPILIGDSPEGRVTLEQIAQAGGCGFATDEEALSTPDGMAAFVEKVFLKKGEPVAVVAPRMVPVPPVPEQKCFTVDLKVEFDFDKSFIRSEYFKTLTAFGDFMGKYPNHTVNLEGHTDNYGTDQYNMKLGQRRAESIRAFLLKYFTHIDPSRLTTVSHGEAQPLASNETTAGRQQNRRVFATFTYCEK